MNRERAKQNKHHTKMKKTSVSSSIRRMIIRRKTKKQHPDRTPLIITESYQVNNNNNTLGEMVVAGGSGAKSKKKGSGARLWMRMDKLGQSEVIECDKSTIIKRVGVPTRDLRVLLGPVFSHSSNILGNSTTDSVYVLWWFCVFCVFCIENCVEMCLCDLIELVKYDCNVADLISCRGFVRIFFWFKCFFNWNMLMMC